MPQLIPQSLEYYQERATPRVTDLAVQFGFEVQHAVIPVLIWFFQVCRIRGRRRISVHNVDGQMDSVVNREPTTSGIGINGWGGGLQRKGWLQS